MKLEVSEVYNVQGLGGYGTLAEAMAAIDKAAKPGTYLISMATKVVASGAGVTPGQPATGKPSPAAK